MEQDRLAYLEQTLASLIARVHALENPPARPVLERPPRRPDRDLGALETTLGTYWLSRIGIVSLITGAALLIITHFGELGSVLRVVLGYAMAGAVAWIGLRLARRHETFGRVVFGGGLAIGYFVTYALHFVPAMRIVDSEVLGVILVALAIATVVAIAHRLQSETVAGIALFLGLHTGMLSDVTELSLVCTTLLAIGAGFFLAKNRWVIVPLSTAVAVYSTHATLALGDQADAIGSTVLIAFLALDFALFAAASLIRPDLRARPQLLLAVVNWAGVLALGSRVMSRESHDAWFAFACSVAGVHALLAIGMWRRRAPAATVANLIGLALATAALALPIRLDGWGLDLGWVALALGAAVIARKSGWPAFAWVAIAILALAQLDARHSVDVEALCILAWFAIERLHAPADRMSAARNVMITGVALSLAQFGMTAFDASTYTIAGAAAAFVLFATGFVLRAPGYRWAGFLMLAAAALEFLTVRLRVLSADARIATFAIAGVVLLAVSFIYTRARRR